MLCTSTLPCSGILDCQKHASATIYSIVESAKENGLKPFDYLEYLFTELPNAAPEDIDKFLPWSESIPEQYRTPKK